MDGYALRLNDASTAKLPIAGDLPIGRARSHFPTVPASASTPESARAARGRHCHQT